MMDAGAASPARYVPVSSPKRDRLCCNLQEALQLPDIVTRVLQHVDTRQRIICCSLVSRTWNTAAGAATASIYVRHLPDSKVTSLQGWLARHGSHLTGLTSVSRSSFSLVSRIAPWLQQLRQLRLSDVKLTSSLVQHDI